MNAREEKITVDFKKENHLSIIVSVFFRVSKRSGRENIFLDVVNWVVLLNNLLLLLFKEIHPKRV